MKRPHAPHPPTSTATTDRPVRALPPRALGQVVGGACSSGTHIPEVKVAP